MTMASPSKIACVGEVMIELVADDIDTATLGVAGDTYNTAVYLQMLAGREGPEVTYVTALGTDTFSDRILSALKGHGIRSDCIERRSNRMPGLYAIETDEQGERSFSYWRGQSAARTLFEEPCAINLETLLQFDLIYISGITMAILPSETRERLIGFLKEYRKSGGKFAFDSNYRPHLWETRETAREVTTSMWTITDIALPSVDDEMALFDDSTPQAVLSRLLALGVSYGALKRGDSGPVPIGEKVTDVSFEPAPNVIDTTAAGDSFNAGFLHKFLNGKTIGEAMLAGHELASKVIQAKGAIVDIQ